MTVSYAGEVPNGSSFGCFWKILWKWRGSVYKLVWRELVAYLCLYYTINVIYRFLLNNYQQKIFCKIRSYFSTQAESIPMSFVLGFYVSLIVKRWWEQYRLLPWPDTLALFISAAIPNNGGGVNNETGRLMRRNIMRYMVLAYVITLQRISLRVKRRFPTTQHLVDAGLMHESEMKIFEAMNQKSPMSKYWMPLVWATNIINRARKEGLIASDHIVQTILMELSDIRRRLGGLIGYDTVCVPLVYTQVVTLVLYTYFIAQLLGRQMLPDMPENCGRVESDLIFPLFTVLQFVFYVGWLKVAEVLINPFGEDDDDIELNWLIDRHIKAAYMIVDEMHEEHPELLRDQYWECVVPKELPYTVASEHYRREEPKGSAELYKVKREDAMYANIFPARDKRTFSDEVYADYESVDTPMVERRKNNWLVRQLSRMGSMRSQSTAYSSSGTVFNRNRLNSVYSSPESGLPMSVMQQQQAAQQQTQQQMQSQTKPSLYEKFVHRKSIRAHKQFIKQQNAKLNGLNVNTGKSLRPRIPTPDVTKEIGEKDLKSKFILTPVAAQSINSTAPGATSTVIMTPPQFSTQPAMYPYTSTASQDGQVLGTLLLSPIKEMDSSSTNNTLIPGHPTTTALAQSVLPSNMKEINFGMKSTPTPNVTTLSFPFTVSTTPADTMSGGNINHVPQVPTITSSTTSTSSFTAADVLTKVPIAIQRDPININELNEGPSSMPVAAGDGNGRSRTNSGGSSSGGSGNGGMASAMLSVKSANNLGGSRDVSRNNSFNANPNISIQDTYVLERKSSLPSTDELDSITFEIPPSGAKSTAANTKVDSIKSNGMAASAPNTLIKRNGEAKTEVYV